MSKLLLVSYDIAYICKHPDNTCITVHRGNVNNSHNTIDDEMKRDIYTHRETQTYIQIDGILHTKSLHYCNTHIWFPPY